MPYLFLLMSMMFINIAHTAPLSADQAFTLTVSIPKQDEVQLNWQIAPGYYLYAKKMQITLPAADVKLPQGEFQYDKANGQYEAYAGNIVIPILLHTKQSHIELTVNYQGCSQAGFCYPPMHKHFKLNLAEQTAVPFEEELNPSLLTNQQDIKALLETEQIGITLLLFAGLGLLLAFTPCILPMIPILTGIIVGHKNVNAKRAFHLSLSYVFGMALTYAIIGLIAAYMGSSLQVFLQKPWIIILTSGLFVLLALSLFGLYDLQLPNRWQNQLITWSNRQKKGTFLGVFFMGAISTLIISPCVTAPLVGVLLYIADTGNMLYGASALFMLGMGMGLPLLLIGSSVGKWLPKTGPWMQTVKYIFGLLMLGMAVWLASRVFSPTVTMPQSFIMVRDVTDLNKQLALAQASHLPVILDFYADWCESCVEMDKKVFSLSDVQQKIKNYVLLRADLSANSRADEALLKHYRIVAPPTVLFFDPKGQELNTQRIVGEVSAKEFLKRLDEA